MNPVEIANHASNQSDRWLFIAALVVMGFMVAYVARYFVSQNAADRAEHKADRAAWEARRTEHEAALKTMVEDGHRTTRELAVVLQKNTSAIEECSRAMAVCQERRK